MTHWDQPMSMPSNWKKYIPDSNTLYKWPNAITRLQQTGGAYQIPKSI